MTKSIILIILSTIFFVGCGNKKAEKKTSLPFPNVEVPKMITNPQEGLDYIVDNYWDAFLALDSTKDTTLLNGVKIQEVEQAFANYLQALGMSGYEKAGESIKSLYDALYRVEKEDSASKAFETLIEFADRYLYDPNSPLRDEEIYFYVASELASCDLISEVEREAYAFKAKNTSLNRIGTKAADFSFSDKSGRTYSLYGLKAEYTILFFSNPDCNACADIINVLNNDAKLSLLLEEGRVKVLNIYIDEDLTAWYKYMPIYPETWYNGYDPNLSIKSDKLYDVRAIPSLYLLDADKNVIFKDATTEKVYNFIQNI